MVAGKGGMYFTPTAARLIRCVSGHLGLWKVMASSFLYIYIYIYTQFGEFLIFGKEEGGARGDEILSLIV
jgi:hypothetical protein